MLPSISTFRYIIMAILMASIQNEMGQLLFVKYLTEKLVIKRIHLLSACSLLSAEFA